MDWLLQLVGSSAVVEWAHEALHSEVSKQTAAFLIAAYLHRGWVKKDMAQQFALLRGTIDHVAEIMDKRINDLDQRIDSLEKKKD